jgi:hypothetical protein
MLKLLKACQIPKSLFPKELIKTMEEEEQIGYCEMRRFKGLSKQLNMLEICIIDFNQETTILTFMYMMVSPLLKHSNQSSLKLYWKILKA